MREIFLGILQFSKAREERKSHIVGVGYVPEESASVGHQVSALGSCPGCTYTWDAKLVLTAKAALNIP